MIAWAHPKRGKWHRDGGQKWFSGGKPATACGQTSIKETWISRPLSATADEDRCRLCWRAA